MASLWQQDYDLLGYVCEKMIFNNVVKFFLQRCKIISHRHACHRHAQNDNDMLTAFLTDMFITDMEKNYNDMNLDLSQTWYKKNNVVKKLFYNDMIKLTTTLNMFLQRHEIKITTTWNTDFTKTCHK